jgi:polysaccharide biosynthesis transport protein
MGNTPAKAAGQTLGEMGVREYLALCERRKFWIVFPALAVAIIVGIIAWRLPNIFRCEAVILVEPQKVPASYVQSISDSGWGNRVSTIYQEVTSPARLRRIIDSMGLYSDIRQQQGEQEAVKAMQRGISVEQVTAMGSQAAAFRISYKGQSPTQVAQVTNQIAAMFIEENLKVREEQSYGTTDFLESELQKTEQQLQEKGNELAQLRAQYSQDLPGAAQFHIQEAEALRQQLQNAEQQITQDQRQKVDLQLLEKSTSPTVDVDLGASASPGESQIDELQTQLDALRSRYGPSHPDVRKLQAQVDQAKAAPADTPAESPAPKTTKPAARKRYNPVIETQLEQLDQDIEKQKDRIPQLQAQINFHLSKVQTVPAFEEKNAVIQREYDALQGRYRAFLDKKLSAQTATDMESREKSERFVILDSAQVPEKPYGPNRPVMIAGGILFGILVGFGVAIAREVVDDSVRNDREAEQILGASVLTGVPEILTPQQLWHVTLKVCSVAVVTVVCAFVIGIGLSNFGLRLQ